MPEPAAIPEVTVTPRDNGPYRVVGPVVLLDADGGRWDIPDGKPVSLCRCGQSATKPFCDGSHRSTGFESRVRAPRPATEA
jgi:CDGSH iron-sulfur domain-containing protein 3